MKLEAFQMKQEPQEIQSQLARKLEAYRLAERISFDEGALEELYQLSDGNWQHAELYAGTAVLDALQHQRTTVSQADIKAVSIAEAIVLMLGGKDIWEDVRYIGINAPSMHPTGVQLRRELSLWDADRNKDTMNAVKDGRLPQYALTDLIQYKKEGTFGPEVNVPFEFDPSKDEVKAVAESFARFVARHTGEPQEVRNISQGDDTFRILYFVQQQTQRDRDSLLNPLNYRVAKGFASGIKGARGVVIINRETLCKHDKTTLEAYVHSLKSQGR